MSQPASDRLPYLINKENKALPLQFPKLTAISKLPSVASNEAGESVEQRSSMSVMHERSRARRKGVYSLSASDPVHLQQLLYPKMQSVIAKNDTRPGFVIGQNVGLQRLTIVRRSIRQSVIEDTPYTVAKSRKLVKAEPGRETATMINEEKTSKKNSLSTAKWMTDRRKKTTFAQIAVLRAGCVFGIEEMMRRTKLMLSLVSDGAECVFVSRKIFLKHAGAKTLRCLNCMIGKYPTEQFIREQLDEQSMWREFRDDVVREVLERREEKLAVPAFLKI